MSDKQSVDPTTLEPIMTTVLSAPTTGATVALSQARNQYLLLNPAGTLLALTVTLPTSPNDGDRVTIGTSQAVTTLTIGAGSNTVLGPISTIAIGGFAKFIFNASTTKWFRIG